MVAYAQQITVMQMAQVVKAEVVRVVTAEMMQILMVDREEMMELASSGINGGNDAAFVICE
jgi:hypothetical protein